MFKIYAIHRGLTLLVTLYNDDGTIKGSAFDSYDQAHEAFHETTNLLFSNPQMKGVRSAFPKNQFHGVDYVIMAVLN